MRVFILKRASLSVGEQQVVVRAQPPVADMPVMARKCPTADGYNFRPENPANMVQFGHRRKAA
jgi:hypothetical protein